MADSRAVSPGTVLVTGAGGQVGAELVGLSWPSPWSVVGLDREALDITDAQAVDEAVASIAPAVVINGAAYTAVDHAEDNVDQAKAVNVDGVANLARAAETHGAWLVHLSTDYVFDGTGEGWYREHDEVNPTSVYGQTKLDGERAALATPSATVIRTSWIYSAHPPNFVLTMRRLASERDQIGVVDDQIGCPTSAKDLADAIAAMIVGPGPQAGLYHLAAPDAATWWELADEALSQGGQREAVSLKRLGTADYPTKARRPANSRLDSSHFVATFGIELPPWRVGLRAVTAEIDGVRA